MAAAFDWVHEGALEIDGVLVRLADEMRPALTDQGFTREALDVWTERFGECFPKAPRHDFREGVVVGMALTGTALWWKERR